MDLVDNLAVHICNTQNNKPIVVAFDGVDTSGKTTLADQIYEALKAKEKNCIRISIDKFHNPKEYRMRSGELSPEGFFYDSFNAEKIIEYVLDPIKNRRGFIIHGIYDYKKEKPVKIEQTQVTNDLIVLFDGIFLNRDELAEYWDLSIFLDVSFDIVLKRAIARDEKYFGSIDEVENRYMNRYIPGEKIYLSTCFPKDRADIVIDNNDFDNKTIIKGNFQLTIASTL